MLEQETPEFIEKCEALRKLFVEAESKIDKNAKVYLITWSPDPSLGPDADFQSQHDFYHPYILSYLRDCLCGVFCVEANQMGNPHYHGWYQIHRRREMGRISWVKLLQEKGIVKISTAKHYKIGKWYERGNALYYYKKDCNDIMGEIDNNPIFQDSEPVRQDHNDMNWDHLFFTPSKLKAMRNKGAVRMDDVRAEYKRLRAFYDVKYKANIGML